MDCEIRTKRKYESAFRLEQDERQNLINSYNRSNEKKGLSSMDGLVQVS